MAVVKANLSNDRQGIGFTIKSMPKEPKLACIHWDDEPVLQDGHRLWSGDSKRVPTTRQLGAIELIDKLLGKGQEVPRQEIDEAARAAGIDRDAIRMLLTFDGRGIGVSGRIRCGSCHTPLPMILTPNDPQPPLTTDDDPQRPPSGVVKARQGPSGVVVGSASDDDGVPEGFPF